MVSLRQTTTDCWTYLMWNLWEIKNERTFNTNSLITYHFSDLSRKVYVFYYFWSLNDPISSKSKISILRRMILLCHTYRTDIKFVTDIPPLSKKIRYVGLLCFLSEDV